MAYGKKYGYVLQFRSGDVLNDKVYATKTEASRKLQSVKYTYPGLKVQRIKTPVDNPGKLRNGEWFGIKAIRKIGNTLQILKNPGPLKKIKVKVL